jgi:hypothetical protein
LASPEEYITPLGCEKVMALQRQTLLRKRNDAVEKLFAAVLERYPSLEETLHFD